MIYFWVSRVARSDVLYIEAISLQRSDARNKFHAYLYAATLKLEARFEINTV